MYTLYLPKSYDVGQTCLIQVCRTETSLIWNRELNLRHY